MSVADSNKSHRAAHHPGAATSWPTSTTWTSLPEVVERKARRPRRFLWRDRGIAAVIAAGIHLAVLFAFPEEDAKEHTAALAPVQEEIPLAMPELEPPEPIEIVEVSDAPATPQLAPPMLMDLPSAVPVSSFIEPMRPVVQPSLSSVGTITIPSVSTPHLGAGGTGVRLFDFKDLDRVPRRVKTVMPVYPQDLRRSRVTGEVVLLVIIDVNGRVEVERVVSATARDFETAAMRAAEQCQFEPPMRGGVRVNARYTWRIPFELK